MSFGPATELCYWHDGFTWCIHIGITDSMVHNVCSLLWLALQPTIISSELPLDYKVHNVRDSFAVTCCGLPLHSGGGGHVTSL